MLNNCAIKMTMPRLFLLSLLIATAVAEYPPVFKNNINSEIESFEKILTNETELVPNTECAKFLSSDQTSLSINFFVKPPDHHSILENNSDSIFVTLVKDKKFCQVRLQTIHDTSKSDEKINLVAHYIKKNGHEELMDFMHAGIRHENSLFVKQNVLLKIGTVHLNNFDFINSHHSHLSELKMCFRKKQVMSFSEIDFIKCTPKPVTNSIRSTFHGINGNAIFEKEKEAYDEIKKYSISEHFSCSGDSCYTESLDGQMYEIQVFSGQSSKDFIRMKEVHIVHPVNHKDLDSYCCFEPEKKKCIKPMGYPVLSDPKLNNNITRGDLNNCKGELCKGSDVFCYNFGCSEAENKFCELDESYIVPQILHKGKHLSFHKILYKTMPILINKERKGERVRNNCEKCIFSCEKGNLSFHTRSSKIEKIIVTKLSHLILHEPNSEVWNNALPPEMLGTPGNVTVKYILEGNDVMLSKEVYCHSMSICEQERSIFSLDYWIYPHCFGPIQYLTAIISVVVFISLLVYIYEFLRYVVLPGVKYFLKVAFAPFFWIKSRCSRTHYRQIPGARRRHPLDNMPIIPFRSKESFDERYPDYERNPRLHPRDYGRFKRQSNIPPWMTILSLIFFALGAKGCNQITSFKVKNLHFQSKDFQQQYCNFDSFSNFSIAPVGESTCIRFETNDDVVLGTLELTTNRIEIQCVAQSLYHVPDFKVLCSSHHKLSSCNESSPSSIFDLGYNSSTVKFDQKELTSKSCVYSVARLERKSPNYVSVYNCSWNLKAHLSASLVMDGKTSTFPIELEKGKPLTLDNGITFTFDKSSYHVADYTNICFIQRGQQWATAPCTKQNIKEAGKIGEVQCRGKTFLNDLNLEKCEADMNGIHFEYKDQSLKCKSDYLDMDDLFIKHKLPKKIGNHIFEPQREGLPISQSVNHNYIFEVKVYITKMAARLMPDKNICFAKFIGLDGCSYCDSGAILTLEVNTNFGSANAEIKCPELSIVKSLSVDREPAKINITIHANSSHVDTECYIICGSLKNNSFKVTGDLKFVPTHVLDNKNSTRDKIIKLLHIYVEELLHYFKSFDFILILQLVGLIFTVVWLIVVFMKVGKSKTANKYKRW